MKLTSLNSQRAYMCEELENYLRDLVEADDCETDFILLQEVDKKVL